MSALFLNRPRERRREGEGERKREVGKKGRVTTIKYNHYCEFFSFRCLVIHYLLSWKRKQKKERKKKQKRVNE